MRDVQFTSIRKKQAQRVERNMKITYNHTLKRKKNSVKCRARDWNLGPLVYEVSALPIELSFRMKT